MFFQAQIDPGRVLARLDELAAIGALANGGVCRLALSEEETEARIRLIGWAQELGCTTFIDPIGNLFLRWGDVQSTEPPVLVGSHLDTQPVGGNYDGVLGVVAALECVEILARQKASRFYPVEIAIWCNEEGARFNPTTMGSAVHAGRIPLSDALAVQDGNKQTVGSALEQSIARYQGHGITLYPRELQAPYRSYVELHIEQGPILEAEFIAIGVVTDIQGLAQFRIVVHGTAGHAGAVPMTGRQDALTHARSIMEALDVAFAKWPDLRYTIGRIEVAPGAINTIPARAEFLLDVRHPDAETLLQATARVEATCLGQEVHRLIYQAPVPFDPSITEAIVKAAALRGLKTKQIVSGATHDAAHMASLCPTGMIFVPCRDGVSHNENEYCEPADVIRGSQVLADTIVALSRCDA